MTASEIPSGRTAQDGAVKPAVTTSPSWRSVAVPTEHGGWSLTAEPVVLGLLVVWSWAGLALGLAAVVAFVARTPLKLVLVDRWRGRWLARTRLAAATAAVELGVFGGLVAAALALGAPGFWAPLAAAAPLIALELWFDMRSRSRRLIPELAGSLGIGSVAAAIALAGGSSDRLAWGLWLVLALRSLAAIPYVRAQVSRAKQRVVPTWPSDVAQVCAVAGCVVGWRLDLMPAATAVVLMGVAALNVVLVRLAPRKAVIIGVEQVVVGAAVIAVTAVALS